MSEYITEDELEENPRYFAEVFAYTSEALDEETPDFGSQVGELAQDYRIFSPEKIEEDMRRMKRTIEERCFPDEYPEDFAWTVATEYSKHSSQFVNMSDLEYGIEKLLEE